MRPFFKVIGGASVLLFLIAACGAMMSSGSDKNSSASSSGKDEGQAVFRVKGYCLATGVADYWTGDGKVMFVLKIRNIGTKTGSYSFVPVRRYSDGEENRSVMDMASTDDITPGGYLKVVTPAFSYKAHEHEIVGCAADHVGDETELAVR